MDFKNTTHVHKKIRGCSQKLHIALFEFLIAKP